MHNPITERGEFGGWELVSQSWEVFSRHFPVLLFGHFICWLIMQGAYSTIIGFILIGPLWLGLSLMCLNAVRGNEVSFEQLFGGFQKLFMPTMILSIITHLMLISLMGFVAVLGILFLTLGMGTLAGVQSMGELTPEMVYAFSFALSCFLVAILLPAVIMIVLYAPAFFILIDEPEMEVWAAMEKSRKMVIENWGNWGRLWVVLSIVHLLGILACCVGYFVAVPWMVLALAMAYERSRDTFSPMDESVTEEL